MAADAPIQERSNSLWTYSLARPVRMMVVLFVIAVLIKILDTFILRLDEKLGEAILTKSLGFVVVLVYLWACGQSLREIGFHGRGVGPSLLIAGVSTGGLILLFYLIQFVVLRASGEEASLALSAMDPKSGKTGTLLFALWLFVANLVNSAMEDGLFRGLILLHFRVRFSVWQAILLQAFFFAIWHLNWPIKNLLDGNATLGEAGFEAVFLMAGTAVSGIVYGYLYHKTGNLWGPFLAHTINNTASNILFYRTSEGLKAAAEYILFPVGITAALLLLIPVFGWWANRYNLTELKPWGQSENSMTSTPP
jgi:membrane protease YdiL (CAAX protease family)